MTVGALLKPLRRGLALDLRRTFLSSQSTVRASVLFALALSIGFGVYYFVYRALVFLQANANAAYIPPSTTLGFILSVIFVMIFISSFVASVGALFYASDLPVVMAAPVKHYQLYFAKLIELTMGASWLVIIFGIPALIGYAQVYGHSWTFWSAVLVAMPPYFIAPASFAMILALLLAIAVPLNRTREFMIALGLVAIVGVIVLLRVTIPSPDQLRDLTVLLSIMAQVLSPPSLSNPGSWTGAVIGNALEFDPSQPARAFFILSLGLMVTLVAVGYMTFALLHARAFSRTQSLRIIAKRRIGIVERVLLRLQRSGPVEVLAHKELLVFVRDPAQAMQLLILAGLCVIYLYNLRMLHAIQGLDADLRAWWQIFLLLSNALLASFVLSAMCTRLVFPSVSLEGVQWWIAQVAPVTPRQVLLAKARAWTVPVCIVAAVIFTAGSLAIGASFSILVATVIAGLLLAWGMVRLAVGLGAQYARFDWEHPSQLAASFGSLVFMLLSVAFMFIAMGGPMLLAFTSMNGRELSPFGWTLAAVASLGFELLIVLVTAQWSISRGARALEARR